MYRINVDQLRLWLAQKHSDLDKEIFTMSSNHSTNSQKRNKPTKPEKPNPDFPLFSHVNSSWIKKILIYAHLENRNFSRSDVIQTMARVDPPRFWNLADLFQKVLVSR